MRGLQVGDYAFDTGPTILQMPQLYDALFASAGLNRADYITFTPLEPYTRLRFWDDTQLDLTTDLDKLKQQLVIWRSDLPEALERWYAEHQRRFEKGYGPFLSEPARSLLGYLRPQDMTTALSFRP